MSLSKHSFNFMLLGKTGAGKSATGNTLTGRKSVFRVSNKPNSCTKVSQLESGRFENHVINVVDTPGLMDTTDEMTVTLDYIHNGMALLPDGFDALILVMRYGDRCTDEVIKVISALRAFFGEVFAKEYCIIVMTHGENFDLDTIEEETPETFDDYCRKITEPVKLLSLLVDSKYKVVLFYNKTAHKRGECMRNLLRLVKNQTQMYTLDIFEAFSSERNECLVGLKLPTLRAPIEKSISLLNEEVRASIHNLDAERYFEIKLKALQLLNTIEKESKGTSLMDDLKRDVKMINSTIDNVSIRKQDSRQVLEASNNQSACQVL